MFKSADKPSKKHETAIKLPSATKKLQQQKIFRFSVEGSNTVGDANPSYREKSSHKSFGKLSFIFLETWKRKVD